jgi:hypothetical protein
MADFIEDLWLKLREAGMPDVMLYLPDHTATRCHWDDTVQLGALRVALLADQERNIVRVVPVSACEGIGLPSPKGIDTMNHRAFVKGKVRERFGPDGGADPGGQPRG